MQNTQNNKELPDNINIEMWTKLGWSPFFSQQWDYCAGGIPARVIGANRQIFHLNTGGGVNIHASVAGKIYNREDGMYPVVGDWVLVKETTIVHILARKNLLSRRAAGNRSGKETAGVREQGMAANLDYVFIVCGLDRDYNPARIERYLMLAYNCGIEPVVLLSKADLQDDPAVYVHEIESMAPRVPVMALSFHDDASIARIASLLSPAITAALVGSSGAGKSTLINRLMGEDVRQTSAVGNRLGKGRHTTTTRDLLMLPCGGMVIDNPGIREIGLIGQETESSSAFTDIESLAAQCRFVNCSHSSEPGCRVLAAIESGELAPRRLNSYLKLQCELEYSRERQKKSAARVEKDRRQHIAKKVRKVKNRRKEQWK